MYNCFYLGHILGHVHLLDHETYYFIRFLRCKIQIFPPALGKKIVLYANKTTNELD